ncbi:hypothetical protein [Pinisolibacter sp.]|uniref:hypothetical protein n=1 Tax=Pinisolibacter sp. TaxID=2172024 RepID=UPI002FDCB56A
MRRVPERRVGASHAARPYRPPASADPADADDTDGGRRSAQVDRSEHQEKLKFDNAGKHLIFLIYPTDRMFLHRV